MKQLYAVPIIGTYYETVEAESAGEAYDIARDMLSGDMPESGHEYTDLPPDDQQNVFWENIKDSMNFEVGNTISEIAA